MQTTALGSSSQLTPQSALTTALSAWETHMRDTGLSENTVKSFGGDIRLLIRYLGNTQLLEECTTAQLNDFLHWLETGQGNQVSCSPKSYTRRVTSLKSLFKWLFESGALPNDPAAAVLQRVAHSKQPEILTHDEITRVLAAAESLRGGHADEGRKPDARPYLLFTLVLHTGIKKSEAAMIAPNHIDLSEPGHPALYIRYSNPRLRHKERKLPLDPTWPAAFSEYRTQYTPREHLFECTPRNLEYVLTNLEKLSGISKRISFENLRWTCALHDYTTSMAPETQRVKLGLSKVTWRDTALMLEELQKQARTAP